jgi:sulfur relay (sulfurtransferase) complex TusBCD TusD component (DsrE family)
MTEISACLIVRDEEAVISRCLDSFKDLVDEIIVVDTGSKDSTKEIVAKYTDKIYDFEWIDDFAAARNFAFSHATKEWIFWIDADELLKEKDQQLFRELKPELDKFDSVTMETYMDVDEKTGKPQVQFKRNRLVRRSHNFKWNGFIHEFMDIPPSKFRIRPSEIAVTQEKIKPAGDRNLRIFKNKKKAKVPFSPRDEYYYGKELLKYEKFKDAIKVLSGFCKDKTYDWVEDRIDGINSLGICYLATQQYAKAREVLFTAFTYATPRAETCYHIAFAYQKENKLEEAIFWYQLCTLLEPPKNCPGFICMDYWTWMPHLQLCQCYCELKDYNTSYAHHKKASTFNPHHEAIKNNEQKFQEFFMREAVAHASAATMAAAAQANA